MALVNPNSGSARFNVIIRREAVVSLAGDTPVIISESEEFNMKLVSDVITGDEISHKDLKEVPNEEVGEDGIWTKAQAAKLKQLSQEELIQMVLQLQQGKQVEVEAEEEEEAPAPKKRTRKKKAEEDAPVKEEAEDTAEEPADQEEEKPKKKRKKKAAPKEEVEDDEVDVEF